MKMTNDEVGVVICQVNSGVCKKKASESTEYEAGEKGRDEYRSSISEISFAKGQ